MSWEGYEKAHGCNTEVHLGLVPGDRNSSWQSPPRNRHNDEVY